MLPLTEKTLELNVISELTYLFRTAGFRPFFIGYSQLSEAVHGRDVRYSLPSSGMFAFFQFKRGSERKRKKCFSFHINNNRPHYNQHSRFCSHAPIQRAAKYVFPLVGDDITVLRNRSHILSQTAFISATDFNPLIPHDKPHLVRVYLNRKWVCNTQKKEGNWEPLLREPIPMQHLDEVAVDVVKELLERWNLPTIGELMDARWIFDEFLFNQRSSFAMILIPPER